MTIKIQIRHIFKARVLRKDKLIHICCTANDITFITLQENSTNKIILNLTKFPSYE